MLAVFPFFGPYVFEEHLDYIFPYLLSVGIIGLFLIFPFPEKLRDNTIWNVVLAVLTFYLLWTIIQISSGIAAFPENGDNDPFGIGQFVLASGIILALIALFYSFSGRLKISVSFLVFIFLIFGTINCFILEFRGDALYAGDFLAIGTAAEVASGYKIIFGSNTFIAIVMLVTILICVFHMTQRTLFKNGLKARLVSIVVVIVCVFGFSASNPSQFLYSWSSKLNHYLVAFSVNIIQMHQPAPKNYSLESVRGIIENNQDTQKGNLKPRRNNIGEGNGENVVEAADIKHPTVIVIMNESFSDLSVLGDLDLNEDYLPFFHSLNSKEANIIKGKLYVDVFGGGTCNTEYSFLTGNTTAFLPENTRPFQLYVDKDTWSLAKTLKAQGYETSAIHPGEAKNWNRDRVYPDLGFDHTYFWSDAVIDEHIVRNFMGDDATYRRIIDIYEKNTDKPQFVFDVTMAGHGGYDMGGTEVLAHQIKAQGELSDLETLNEYLTVMRECDGALQEFLAYFEKREDPVVVVFFGDHQPNMDREFYDRIKNKPKSEWNDEENFNLQVTPYLIWSNYDFDGQAEDEDISINFLQQKFLKAAGIDEITAYDNYETMLVKDFPIVSIKGIVDKNGNYQSVRNAKNNEPKINEYQQVVYNNMIDVKNTLTDLFTIEKK